MSTASGAGSARRPRRAGGDGVRVRSPRAAELAGLLAGPDVAVESAEAGVLLALVLVSLVIAYMTAPGAGSARDAKACGEAVDRAQKQVDGAP